MEFEDEFDLLFLIPLICTALAIILAMLWLKRRAEAEKKPSAEPAHREETKERSHQEKETKERVTETLEEEKIIDQEDPAAEEEVPRRTQTVPVEEVGAHEELSEAKESETEAAEYGEKETTPSSQSSQEEEDSKEEEDEEVEAENDKLLKISEADDAAEDKDFSFKYLPGKLRGSDYEKMLTKDELEEEQRIELTSDFTSL